ncbi:subtilisin-like serine protease [Thioflavicoccus mobilis 8321]|uniref:Subtilisin-like serine protease n=1 Tax=Thioflavicoccus mobilis 8321 TaxID=765912 RepID=L0GYK4_9GAMM|nr:S8 family serine peptidase [Thioflavicoccus mobilis]AGA91021.1 subtilisin-like serine protease [Thioflavicoccus mobilis 8321]
MNASRIHTPTGPGTAALATLLLVLALLLPGPAAAQTTATTLLVTPSAPLSQAEAEALRADYAHHLAQVARLRRSGSLLIVELQPHAEPAEAIEALLADPRIARVELDPSLSLEELPNDPEIAEQWGLHDASSGIDIGFYDAYPIGIDAEPVLVAVIDSGVDLDHPDLVGRIATGIDLVDGDAEPWDTHPQGHGTMVAGIIAANADDGVGIAGVCAPCRILPIRVTGDGRFATSKLIEAIDLIIEHQPSVQVVNISAGLAPGLHVAALREALRDAAAAGITVVVAAGNDGAPLLGEPAAYPETIAVGAIDSTGRRADFSSKGESLDLVAPGVDILSSCPSDFGGMANDYGSGTSYAAPFVTGVVGLMKALEPDLTPPQLRGLLLAGTRDLIGPDGEDEPGWDRGYGWGLLDAYAALTVAPPLQPPPTPVALGIAADTLGELTMTWQPLAEADDYRIYRSTDPATLGELIGHAAGGDRFTDRLLPGTGGAPFYRVVASDAAGDSAPSAPLVGPWLCPAPFGVTATAGITADRVLVRWQPVDGASGYRVYRAKRPTETGSLIAEVSETAFDDDSFGITTPHYYRVSAVVQGCRENPGRPVVGWHAGLQRPPPAPTGLTASDNGFGFIDLWWDPTPGAMGYRIYRAPSASGPWSLRHTIPIADPTNFGSGIPPLETHWVDVTVPDGYSYYRIRALEPLIDGGGFLSGPYSEVVAGWSRPVRELLPSPPIMPLYIDPPLPLESIVPIHIDPLLLKPIAPIHIDPLLLKPIAPIHIDPLLLKPIAPIHVDPLLLKPIAPIHIDPLLLKPIASFHIDPLLLKPIAPAYIPPLL